EADLPVVEGKPDLKGFLQKLNDPAHRMMSPAQEAWLGGELHKSVKGGQAWQVIGSGVVMGRLKVPDPQKDFPPQVLAGADDSTRRRYQRMGIIAEAGLPYGLDMWDGYPTDRERV